MAHLGFRAVALVVFLIGCGGKVGESSPASSSDTGVPSDAPDDETPLPAGFESFTATLTEVTATWMYGGGSGSAQPSRGLSFRIDVDARGGRVVAMAPFGRAVALGGFPGAMKATDGASFFGASATSYEHVTDNYDALEIVLGADGWPASGIARGRSERLSGDVGYEGTLEAKVSFTRDAVKPAFRATANLSFASVPLPWDQRVVEASEPYEEGFGPIGLLGGDLAKRASATDVLEAGWGAQKKRGTRFTFAAWDAVAGIGITPGDVHDLAGNASERSMLRFEGAIDVPYASGSTFRFGDAKSATWGTTKIVSDGCKSGSCLQIGPFRWSYCARGSAGGAAIRMPNSGAVSAQVRGHAVPVMTYPGYPGGGTPPTTLVQLAAAIPSGDVKLAEASTVKWSSASSDGSFDTGWTSIATPTPGAAAESGIAVGGGGTGPYSSSCDVYGGPPVPEAWDVTIWVEDVTLSK